ncbi:hypothetical protein Pla111_06610 [Botrimarina hoheduenensis]|uniref:DUF2007 domain-containing protein n=2 Tax=Botrimarina hoheduenensis TaxID=2528000 RepID=A0A5C5WFM1_9BACT|nr:hypothetical protein Pla111_06610 [Botrimarina hoheduenensis]
MDPCPDCGQPRPPSRAAKDEESALVRPLTTTTSLAEAGFLADRLQSAGFAARVHSEDSFDAIRGAWQHRAMVLVTADQAIAAAEHLQQVLAEDPAPRELGATASPPATIWPTNFWIGVAVLATAAWLGLSLSRPAAEPNQDLNAPRPGVHSIAELGTRVARLPSPLITLAPNGAARHRLSYDEKDKQWLWETDANGDGVYDRRERYRNVP